MKKLQPADASFDDFLSNPIIFSHRPGKDTRDSETETPEDENATPARDVGKIERNES